MRGDDVRIRVLVIVVLAFVLCSVPGMAFSFSELITGYVSATSCSQEAQTCNEACVSIHDSCVFECSSEKTLDVCEEVCQDTFGGTKCQDECEYQYQDCYNGLLNEGFDEATATQVCEEYKTSCNAECGSLDSCTAKCQDDYERSKKSCENDCSKDVRLCSGQCESEEEACEAMASSECAKEGLIDGESVCRSTLSLATCDAGKIRLTGCEFGCDSQTNSCFEEKVDDKETKDTICTDSDEAGINYQDMPIESFNYVNIDVKGTAQGKNGVGMFLTLSDSCEGTTLIEAFCDVSSNVVREKKIICPSGTACESGVCALTDTSNDVSVEKEKEDTQNTDLSEIITTDKETETVDESGVVDEDLVDDDKEMVDLEHSCQAKSSVPRDDCYAAVIDFDEYCCAVAFDEYCESDYEYCEDVGVSVFKKDTSLDADTTKDDDIFDLDALLSDTSEAMRKTEFKDDFDLNDLGVDWGANDLAGLAFQTLGGEVDSFSDDELADLFGETKDADQNKAGATDSDTENGNENTMNNLDGDAEKSQFAAQKKLAKDKFVVETVAGDYVQYHVGRTEQKTVEQAKSFGKGGVISTGFSSTTNLNYENILKIHINEKSKVRIDDLDKKSQLETIELKQYYGKAVYNVKQDQKLHLEVETPNTIVKINGAAEVTYDKSSRKTEVKVIEGEAHVTSLRKRKEVTLEGGEETIEKGRANIFILIANFLMR